MIALIAEMLDVVVMLINLEILLVLNKQLTFSLIMDKITYKCL